jgi:hypothetical protein
MSCGLTKRVNLSHIVDDINCQRVKLSIPHSKIRECLGVCRNTYSHYRVNNYQNLTIYQIYKIFDLFEQIGLSELENARIRNHYRNRVNADDLELSVDFSTDD